MRCQSSQGTTPRTMRRSRCTAMTATSTTASRRPRRPAASRGGGATTMNHYLAHGLGHFAGLAHTALLGWHFSMGPFINSGVGNGRRKRSFRRSNATSKTTFRFGCYKGVVISESGRVRWLWFGGFSFLPSCPLSQIRCVLLKFDGILFPGGLLGRSGSTP